MKVKNTLFQLSGALTCTLLVFCLAAIITLNFRPLYYFDITACALTKQTGLSREEIKTNYDTLIDYNCVLHQKPLVLPSFPMSEKGRTHFKEVKHIFDQVQITAIALTVIVFFFVIYGIRKKNLSFLKTASQLTLLIPALLALLIAFGWERFFIMMHRFLFRNNYWIFDNDADPVINILPDMFFLHCTLLALLLIASGSIICRILYRKFNQQRITNPQ